MKTFLARSQWGVEFLGTDCLWDGVVTLVALLLVSAVWFETDAYRYAALLLLVPAIIHYFRHDVRSPGRLRIGPMGLLCLGWGVYVAVRLNYHVLVYPERGNGSAEGIYLFPLFYPALGYALWLYVRRPFAASITFLVVSFIFVLWALDSTAISENVRTDFYFHNNPIHAAVATGIVVLCMLPLMSYILRRKMAWEHWRYCMLVAATITFMLGLMNIYALRSKGVWLAMVVALPLQFFITSPPYLVGCPGKKHPIKY